MSDFKDFESMDLETAVKSALGRKAEMQAFKTIVYDGLAYSELIARASGTEISVAFDQACEMTLERRLDAANRKIESLKSDNAMLAGRIAMLEDTNRAVEQMFTDAVRARNGFEKGYLDLRRINENISRQGFTESQKRQELLATVERLQKTLATLGT